MDLFTTNNQDASQNSATIAQSSGLQISGLQANHLWPSLTRSAASQELIFIDASVQDAQGLIQQRRANTSVYVLDATQDGIDQISQVLANFQDVAAIHIVSHGSAGFMNLGSTALSKQSLGDYGDRLRGWAAHLSTEADILLYGCDVAAGLSGQAFVQAFGSLTQADIAASDDVTGTGGDWILEVNTGEIATQIAFEDGAIAAYQHSLVVDASALASVNSAGTLTLNIGPNAGLRGVGESDGNEQVRIESRGLALDGSETVEVFYNDGTTTYSQIYANVFQIYAEGGAGNDAIQLVGVQSIAQLWGDFNPIINPTATAFGNDTLIGGNGITIFSGGDGNDLLQGGIANDQLYGDAGNDTLIGNDGNDFLFGDVGNDRLNSGNGDDTLVGGDGDDQLDGELGNDQLSGGAGNDALDGGSGNDSLDGGAGIDTISGGGGVDVLDNVLNLATLSPVGVLRLNMGPNASARGLGQTDGNENFRVEEVSQQADGSETVRVIFTVPGVETYIQTYQGVRQIEAEGGAGSDRIEIVGDRLIPNPIPSLPPTTLPGVDAPVFLWGDFRSGPTGSDGNDTLIAGNGNAELYGQVGNDQLFGGAGNDFIDGDVGDDTLSGSAGNDRIFGRAGNDLIDGGSGNDSLVGNDGNDTLRGQEGNDSLEGNNGDDRLEGGDGNDQLTGSDGVDSLFGQTGNDTLLGNAGNDFLSGGAGNDRLDGNEGNDVLFGEEGQRVALSGGGVRYESINLDLTGNDVLRGQAGDDLMIGGSGNDDIFGESGFDLVLGDNGNITLNAAGNYTEIRSVVSAGDGSDSIEGIFGIADVIIAGGGNDVIDTVNDGEDDGEDDIIFGDSGVVIRSNPGNQAIEIASIDDQGVGGRDTITAGAGDDILIGGAERSPNTGGFDDQLFGQAGTDILIGDGGRIIRNAVGDFERIETVFVLQGGNDRLEDIGESGIFLGGTGNDAITASVEADLIVGDNGEILFIAGEATEIRTTAVANGGNDTISGGNAGDIIFGGSGNDGINAGTDDAIDIIFGDNGEVLGGTGLDEATQLQSLNPDNGGADTIAAGGGNDFIIGGAEANNAPGDILRGDAGNDIIAGDRAQILRTTTGIVQRVETFGTGGNDFLEDTTGTSLLIGGGGNDTLTAGETADILVGDNGLITYSLAGVIQRIETRDVANGGNDQISAGNGSDTVFGGTGNDSIIDGSDTSGNIFFGDNGVVVRTVPTSAESNDLISTDPTQGGTDTIRGGAGNDIIIGGSGNADTSSPATNDGDRLFGAEGDDIVIGDNARIFRNSSDQIERIETTFVSQGGDDSLEGNEGRDRLIGGLGNDTIQGQLGDDWILGDNGFFDYLSDEDLTTLDIVESTSPGGNDQIAGDAGADSVLGGAANDNITGNSGDDILFGDNGRIRWNAAGQITRLETVVSEDDGQDTIAGNDQSDRIFGGGNNDTITGDADADIILGDYGRLDYVADASQNAQTLDIITTTDSGLGGNDSIQGNVGSDRILGGFGNDVIEGNQGQDWLLGDNGTFNYILDDNASTLDLVTTTAIAGDSNPDLGGNDTIQGNEDEDIAIGGAGNDSIRGNAGNDYLLGDNGQFIYTGGQLQRFESLNPGNGGSDTVSGDDGNDLMLGGFGADVLRGNAGDDKVLGDNGLFDFAFVGDSVVGADNNFTTLDFLTTTNPTLGGNDTIEGGAGNDQLLGGTGSDRVYGDNPWSDFSTEWEILGSGDFNFDGKSDILWRHRQDGRIANWLMNGSEPLSVNIIGTVSVSMQLAGIQDFNGDRKKDILWRDRLTGAVTTWLVDGSTVTQSATTGAGLDWSIVDFAEVSGDTRSDIVWRHQTGQVGIWLMNGTQIEESAIYGDASLNWQILDLGDINGDGRADIFWRQSNGETGVWLLNGTQVITRSLLPFKASLDWQVVDMNDLNRDNKADIVWRNRQDGTVGLWLMNGLQAAIPSIINTSGVSLDWQIAGLSDVNGDQWTDIIWHNPTVAMTGAWLMNGPLFQQAGLFQQSGDWSTPGNWQIKGIHDFNGDGKVDILWQDSIGGTVTPWLLSGFEANPSNLSLRSYGVKGFDDLIMGDHGKVYQALPRDRNYVSIDTAATNGGGNDQLFGNDGDDFILGQQGDDQINGGAGEDDILGGHNVVGGADGNDTIDGGAHADVVLGDNGRITRRPLADGEWQRYPVPFADVIRDVERFDDRDRIGGNDVIRGGAGDDILQGQRGNDTIEGDAGDDEIYGQLGSDVLRGGDGQDFILGDVGIITRAYNPDGTPRRNANGSWHRDALLTEVGELTGVYAVDAVPGPVLQTADTILLSGGYNADGSPTVVSGTWQTQASAIVFEAGGNDVISGGNGEDVALGQGGNDAINGNGGNDYLEGGAGNDSLNGGAGDDWVIGDNSESPTAFNREQPIITRGYHLITQANGLNFNLGPAGAVIVPNLRITPQRIDSLIPMMTTLSTNPVAGSSLQFNSNAFRPLVAIVPDLANHLDLLAGNDVVADTEGNNTLVGDDYVSVVPLRTGNNTVDQTIDQLTTQLHHLGYDLNDLEIARSVGQSPQTFVLGSDRVEGGSANDLMFGDNAIMYGSFSVREPANLNGLNQLLNDVRQLLGRFSTGINAQLSPFTGLMDSPHTVSMGNDTMGGGAGNDQLFGADTLIVSPVLNTFNYQRGSFWSYGFDRTPKAVRSNFRDSDFILNNDTMGGGEGDDWMVGGYASLITPLITRGPANNAERLNLRQSLELVTSDVKAFIRDLHNERYGIDYRNRDQLNRITADNDTMGGENGDDIQFGGNVTLTLPFLNGQINAGLTLPNGDLNYAGRNLDTDEEAHNFFDLLPHKYNSDYRAPANTRYGQDVLGGGSGNDILFGLQGADSLYGEDGNDQLFGGRDDDPVLDGGAGNNLIRNTNPSPADDSAMAGRINSRLQGVMSPTIARIFLELLANSNAQLAGDLYLKN